MHVGELVQFFALLTKEADVLLEPLKPYLAPYLTPSNVVLGVSSLLAVAGLSHAVPGPMAKLQSTIIGIPEWFLTCAGLLMMASGGLFYTHRAAGLGAVAICMGGSGATAAMMPSMLHRPGGMVFSVLTLGAAVWAYVGELGQPGAELTVLVLACYAAGVAGRVYVPTSAAWAEHLKFLGGEDAKAPAAAPAALTAPAAPAAPVAPAAPAAPKAAAAPAAPKAAAKASAASSPRAAAPATAAAARGGAARGAATSPAAGTARLRVDTPPPRRSE